MINGILPPITTPFINGEIAYEKLAFNIDRFNKTGIAGVVALGSNGESQFLTGDEKIEFIKAVKRHLKEDKVLIAATGSDSIKETVHLTNEAAESGADFALILTPSFYKSKMTSEALVSFYMNVADKAQIPIIIYNVPKFTGVNIETEAVVKISIHENVAGIKNSSENVGQLTEIISATPPSFSTLVGTASVLYPGFCVGASGAIVALANIAPTECIQLKKYFDEGRHAEALGIQKRLLELNKAITSLYGVAGLKIIMDLIGLFGGDPRSPLIKSSKNEINHLKEILHRSEINYQ